MTDTAPTRATAGARIAAGLAIAGVVMLLYPIRKGTHERIVEELAARRAP